jgi:hypothetical protein
MHRHTLRSLNARELALSILFGCVLLLRLYFPFWHSPLLQLYSDPLRHWTDGHEFLHPTVMGSGDPYLYQLWLFVLQHLAGAHSAVILGGCGLLCAAMPYGWYRALRELAPRERSLWGAVLIGLWPPFLAVYGFFMTETLLLTLTGFAFALTLRAARKRSSAAFAAACALWLAACFTRVVLLPLALICLVWLWTLQPHRLRAVLLALLMSAVIAIPAGLHGRAALGYFAPLGNLYLNEIYYASERKEIQIDYGPQGDYWFGSPSYYNPTFYPFSDWTTARQGRYVILIDTRHGRDDWIRALQRARLQAPGWHWRDFAENLCYLFFGQSWPENLVGIVGRLSVWCRWLWLPIVLWTLVATARARYHARAWLIPLCALASLGLLALQHEAVLEGRYRKPIEPIFMAALVLSRRGRRVPDALP